eukprot:scaffold22340_cov23-Cyclotella_meneghiniana.AAC.1
MQDKYVRLLDLSGSLEERDKPHSTSYMVYGDEVNNLFDHEHIVHFPIHLMINNYHTPIRWFCQEYLTQFGQRRSQVPPDLKDVPRRRSFQ